MKHLSDRKVILITRETRLKELVNRFNTIGQARFYIESQGGDFSDYEREDARYQSVTEKAERQLSGLARIQVVERSYLPNFIFGETDVVVAIGQDGLVANTVKYLKGQPLIGVNPDPDRWDGKLLPFQIHTLPQVTASVLMNQARTVPVTLAEANLNDGQSMLAVNDLFIGPQSHSSARYTLSMGEQREQQSSSGIIVSTGLGSTGWYRSLICGASALIKAKTGKGPARFSVRGSEFGWDAESLAFTVREPFPSKTTGTEMVHGTVTPDHPLMIESHMPEHGVIFSDGIEADFINFNAGSLATITIASQKGCLVTS